MTVRFALALLLLAAPPAVARPDDPVASVLAEVEAIHSEDGLRNASLGFAIAAVDPKAANENLEEDQSIDPDVIAANGEERLAETTPAQPYVAGYHLDTALMPASTLKVVTTATALELLGPDFRFVTRLQHTGTIKDDGTLDGHLVIAGGGDPTLGASHAGRLFSDWRRAVIDAGIKNVSGRVIGDDRLFGSQLRPDSWQWNDLGNYYAAGASALTFHRNEFRCRFRTGESGSEAAFLGTLPKLPELTFINEMRVGPEGSGDHGYVYGAPYGELLYLRGTVPAGGREFSIRGALPDPARFCARAFSRHLGRHDIETARSPTTARLLAIAGEDIGKRHELLEHRSEPLSKLIAVTNFRSDNLYAECLHRMIGVTRADDGSTAAASKAVVTHWEEQGLDLTGFQMADGCGLSRANSITARQMVLLLTRMTASEHFETFFKSLPVAGESGTLRSIGKHSPSAGRVHAKSGSFERVKTYCGYIDAKSGRRYAFALFINHYTGEVGPVKDKIVRVWNRIVEL